MSLPSTNPIDMLSYEQAFAELEGIVAALESGDQSLEIALVFYERGQLLTRRCAELLDQAELKISQLSGDQQVEFLPPSETR